MKNSETTSLSSRDLGEEAADLGENGIQSLHQKQMGRFKEFSEGTIYNDVDRVTED